MQNYNSKLKSDLKTRCYRFSLEVVKFMETLPNQRSCWIIADQLSRSSMSVGANLVEATSSGSRLEFKRYHEIALKISNETKYWLGLLRDCGKADREKANELLQEVTEISNMIASGVMKLKGKK